jgi:uncharacterized membrane protein SpoIIM required for sporulation
MSSLDEFIRQRRPEWDALRALLDRAGRDPRRLDAAEIERLGQAYRRVVADLALARRDFPGEQVVGYLNGLATRAYPLVYRAPAGSWRRIARFFLADFPRLYRESGAFVLAAFLLFALPAVAGYLVVMANPPAAEAILPPSVVQTVKGGRLWTDAMGEDRAPLFSSTIATNNLQVSILAFAGGILLGTLTVYVLILNGLMLGAVFAYVGAHGLDGRLLAFVSPHGYVELTVVFIAGGAGLRMAWALARPGLLGRRDALARAGGRAALLVLGAAPLLLAAGLIEGFVSPSPRIPDGVKYAVGPLTGLALHAFLLGPALRRLLPRRRGYARLPAHAQPDLETATRARA